MQTKMNRKQSKSDKQLPSKNGRWDYPVGGAVKGPIKLQQRKQQQYNINEKDNNVAPKEHGSKWSGAPIILPNNHAE